MIKFSENERIISVSRKHWWILAEKIIAIFFLSLVPFFVYLAWSLATPQISFINEDNSTIANSLIIFGSSLYYLFLWLYFSIIFIDYYLDIWIITNMRILDVEQKGLFNREVSECYISKIEDVTVEIKGILPTFLNYGDLRAQTAAEKREFVFKQIPDPTNIKNIILEQYNKQHSAANH